MSKKNVNGRRSVQVPERVSMDVIGTMTDEELAVSFRSLDEAREKVLSSGGDAQPWEEELAYLRREQQIRRARRDVHEKWCRELERELAIEEAMLPVADLDNSSFMFAGR